MSRRIVPRSKLQQDAASAVPDDYLGRLVKYIPAEIVAVYLLLRGLPPADRALEGAVREMYWAIAIACWVAVPVYLWIVTTRQKQPPIWLQIVLATIAFPVWVFAIGGYPADYVVDVGHRFIVSVVLVLVTFIFGWFQPSAPA